MPAKGRGKVGLLSAAVLAMAVVIASAQGVEQKKAAPLAKNVPPRPAPPRSVNTSPLTFEGVYAGAKSVTTAQLVFQGSYAGSRTVTTTPLEFKGAYAGVVAVNVPALSFQGQYAGVKTVNTARLSFEGVPAAVNPSPNTKGVHK
jgi:hypothetical protein